MNDEGGRYPVDSMRVSTIADLVALSVAQGGALAGIEPPPLAGPGLEDYVARLAAALRAVGLGTGDRIAIVLPNGPRTAACLLATMIVGTAAPLNPSYRVPELRCRMRDLHSAATIVDPDRG